MPIMGRRPEQNYTPAPEGLHHAVCVDVVDLGEQETRWGSKYKVRFIWQIDEVNPDTNRRFEVRKDYTNSLHEKANIRKDLESWRGRKFNEAETEQFDYESVIGANCQVQVIHNISGEGNTWANVQGVVPAPRNTTPLKPLDYTRVQDRESDHHNGDGQQSMTKQLVNQETGVVEGELTEDDIPF